MTTHQQTFAGMTGGHCVNSVIDELTALPGVRDVKIELVVGGISTAQISSDAALDPAAPRTAVAEAGYQVDITT